MESGLLLLKTAGALALVLGLFFAFIYALKRWGNLVKRPASQTMMEILSKHSFGPRHHLILVSITGEERVLVGISPQNMSLYPLHAPPKDKNPSDDVTENV